MKLMVISPSGIPPILNSQSYRIGKIIKFLKRADHDIIGVTHEPTTATLVDQRLRSDMEKYGDIELVQLPGPLIPSRFRVVRLLNMLGIPDNYLFWTLRYFRRLTKMAERNGIECIITSNTPSAQILGSMLARRLNIKWIADLADLWVENPNFYMPTRLHRVFQSRLEKMSIEKASLVCYAGSSWGELIVRRIPRVPTLFVPNGYDQDDFRDAGGSRADDGHLSFCYFGTIYGDFDLSFMRAFISFIEKNADARSRCEFALFGNIAPRKLGEIETLTRDIDNVKIFGMVPHCDLVERILDADVLVFSQGAGAISMYGAPSRLAVCIGSGKPTIACCLPGSNSEAFCLRYGCWRTIDPRDTDSIERCFEDAWKEFSSRSDNLSKRYWNELSEEIQWERIVRRLLEHLS